MKRVKWVRIEHLWQLFVSGVYQGIVSVDGDVWSSRLNFNRCFGSQPLAAQALLRAAGVEP